ncbi:MAG: hypothetical protein H0W50_06840 [Parachlamydiaceae bacterium]|nr:hypothetical protein [Parachlamydiaceae bacterium]
MKFLKYSTAIIIGTCLMAYCSMPDHRLSTEQQNKIWESVLNLDHSVNHSEYFEIEPTTDEEFSRGVRPGEIMIHFANGGFTPGSRYRLFRTLTGNKSEFMGDVIALDSGELIIKGERNIELKNFHILVFGHMLGEESAFTLMSEDGQTYLTAVAVQKPIIAQGADGITMRVRLYSRIADMVLLQCSGLKPNEELNLMSTSCNEVHHNEGKADANGWFQHFTNPCVIGSQGGEGSFVIFRKNGDYLKINYLWGEEAIKTARVGLENH